MLKNLKRPWLAALTTTVLLLVMSIALRIRGGIGTGSETLPLLSPSGAELAVSAGSAVLVLLALWALFWLAGRISSRTS